MAPSAEGMGTGGGAGRVLPDHPPPPAHAWAEHEGEPSSPGESRRLLPTQHKSHLQAGLTLGVHSPKHLQWPQIEKRLKKKKTKFQKRKEWLIAVLKPPYFILSMIIILVCIQWGGGAWVRGRLEWSPDAWWREPWRLVTYSCVHATRAHLTLNALVALALGWRLEREQAWWRVACVWGAGAAAGALGAGALQQHVRVVGASAAVYALLTAHLPNVCLRFGHIPLWWFRLLSVFVLSASEGCWSLVSAPATDEHVAWAAHVLGAAAGVPLAFIFFTGEHVGKPHIRIARIISVLVLVAGVALAAAYYAHDHESDKK